MSPPTVMVTGANRGLGLEFARQYAADGWRVIGTHRTPGSECDLLALGAQVESHPLDVTDQQAVQALARRLDGTSIDLFIANAGVMPSLPGTAPLDIPDAAWQQAFTVNVVAPLACAAAFAPHIARSRQRKLVALSSWVASIGSNTAGGHYVYRASKSALNAVWRSFAIDHPELIAVLLSPGALRTDMTHYDQARWDSLPLPQQSIAKLRAIIAGLDQADSGTFHHVDGTRLPW